MPLTGGTCIKRVLSCVATPQAFKLRQPHHPPLCMEEQTTSQQQQGELLLPAGMVYLLPAGTVCPGQLIAGTCVSHTYVPVLLREDIKDSWLQGDDKSLRARV